MSDRARDYARVLLAGIRLFNGGAGLLAPQMLARRLGVDPDANPGVAYFVRLFGIRTVIIGAELLLRRDERQRRKALRLGILIHASDTLAAALAAGTGRLPPRVGPTITAISALNTILAVYAASGSSSPANGSEVEEARGGRLEPAVWRSARGGRR